MTHQPGRSREPGGGILSPRPAVCRRRRPALSRWPETWPLPRSPGYRRTLCTRERSRLSHCTGLVCWLVACFTSQQHASVSQGRICSDDFTCCHTEIGIADQTFYLTQSQYTDAGPTSLSTDHITPGAWQGSHWSANF